jgi:hypothetical protein
MYALFHISAALIFLELLRRSYGRSYSPLLAAVCAVLPDLVDKPLSFFELGPGRGYAHTLAFAGAVVLLAWALGGGDRVGTAAVGVLAHLLLDLMYLPPLFFPLNGVEVHYTDSGGILFFLGMSLERPVILLTEGLSSVFLAAYISARLRYTEPWDGPALQGGAWEHPACRRGEGELVCCRGAEGPCLALSRHPRGSPGR